MSRQYLTVSVKLNQKLDNNDFSCVDETLTKIQFVVGNLVCTGSENHVSPTRLLLNSASYCGPVLKSKITQPAVRDYDFVHQDHPTCSNDLSCNNY